MSAKITNIQKMQPEDYLRLNPLERENYYENLVETLIRKRYTINQELAILRQRDVKLEEFYAYNIYAEECKQKAKEILNII